jgi:predicted ester cyclase
MTVEENKATIRRFYEEGANARNPDVIRAAVAPEFVGHYPEVMAGLSGTSRGAESLVQDLGFIGAMVPDFRTTIEDLVGSGDRVAVRGSTRGNHTGEIPGVPPTNRAVAFTWCAIYRFTADGRIVERWMNDDALSTFQQLGLVPQLPPPPAA